MLMALILAALAWFVALEQADPTVERTYPQSIPVSVAEPAEDLLMVGTFDERVQIKLRTTQTVWESLEVEDFEVTADLTGLGPGAHEVPLEISFDKEPAEILAVTPQTVVVELDSRTNRIVPVRIEVEGEPAVGYVSRTRRIQPRDVTVKGPTSYVTRVVEAFAALSIEGAQQSAEETLSVQPLDSEGDTVPYVSLTPDAVDVRITIEPSGYHSTLAVKAVLTGEVASGYRITDISIDPPTVMIFGNPADLAAIEEGFIETKPINVAGAQKDVVVRPGLGVPPKVTVVPGQQVEVEISVEAIESSLTITSTPEVQGLGPTYTATLSPDVVQVVLNGPLPRLESLRPEDVRVVLDLFDLPVGTHQIEPEVIAPEEITPQSLIPATIQVKISEAPTPTPLPEPTITSTATATITSTRTITGQ
jgi:YbbR domain-containing protein